MVQYGIFQHFDQKLQKTKNFLWHHMSLYISIFFSQKDWGVRKFKFQLLGIIQSAQRTPEIGCFFLYEIQHFCCFITQLVKKLHQSSLYEVIKDTLPIVLNTIRPLSNIWLHVYKQNSFGCLKKNIILILSKNNPKLFCT